MEAISLLHVPGSRTLIEAGGMRALCDVMRRNAHDADMQVSHAGRQKEVVRAGRGERQRLNVTRRCVPCWYAGWLADPVLPGAVRDGAGRAVVRGH